MNPEERVAYFLDLCPQEEVLSSRTFWSKSKKTVRYLRIFRPTHERTVVAVLTEIAGGAKIRESVTLFVETPKGKRATEFTDPKPTMEFMQSLFDNPVLELIEEDRVLEDVQMFLFTPDRTVLTTW